MKHNRNNQETICHFFELKHKNNERQLGRTETSQATK